MRGSGNVFSDFGDADAEVKQLKAQLAAEIIGTLDTRALSTLAAAMLAEADPADIQRIRNADLSRFSLDCLIRIAHCLGRHVDISVSAPDVRAQLHRAINDAFDDPRPSLPAEEVFARLRAAIREGRLTEAIEQRGHGDPEVGGRLDAIRGRIRRSLDDPRPDLSSQEVDANLEALAAQAKEPRDD